MAFKFTLLVCGLLVSVQHSFGQTIGLRNAAGLSYGAREVDITTIGIDSRGGSGYGNGFGIGNAGLGLGSAGLGWAGAGLGSAALAANPTYINLNSYTGGVLPISSYGPIVPVGLTVVSDNRIEGNVAVNGQLPFLSAVAFEGTLPSAGSGVTQCGCGNNGNIGIVSETVGPAAGVANAGLGLGGRGLAGIGSRSLY